MNPDTSIRTRPIRNTRAGRSLVAVTAFTLAAAGPLTGCGSDGDAADDTSTTTEASGSAADIGSDATNELTIADVWARPGTAGGNSAVYMTITGGGTDDALVGVSIPPEVVTTAEVHETVEADAEDGDSGSGDMGSGDMGSGDMDSDDTGSDDDGEDHGDMGPGGMKTMREVESIAIPAGETVTLEPGGYHIMMMDLEEDLQPGDTVEVTLEFESGATETVTAEVREP